MEIRIFTLPFDPIAESFPDEIIGQFRLNKRIHKLESHFFQQEGRAYWSVAIHYEILVKEDSKGGELDEQQQLLYTRLREWRKETAEKEGVPVYLIATNQQLVDVIKGKVQTLDSFKGIKGFGKGKIERYGRQMVAKLKSFYEEAMPSDHEPETPAEMPF
jgi:superfamily II DNA helicase RecQ